MNKQVQPMMHSASPVPRELVDRLLRFFYPIHYRLGMDLETVMCQGRISRKQAAILWLLHDNEAGGASTPWLRRREVENCLSTWFEMSSSNVSKLLRELVQPPLQLILQVENPKSGREKLVSLTPAGRDFVEDMIAASIDYLTALIPHVSAEDMLSGVNFLSHAFDPVYHGTRARSLTATNNE